MMNVNVLVRGIMGYKYEGVRSSEQPNQECRKILGEAKALTVLYGRGR